MFLGHHGKKKRTVMHGAIADALLITSLLPNSTPALALIFFDKHSRASERMAKIK